MRSDLPLGEVTRTLKKSEVGKQIGPRATFYERSCKTKEQLYEGS